MSSKIYIFNLPLVLSLIVWCLMNVSSVADIPNNTHYLVIKFCFLGFFIREVGFESILSFKKLTSHLFEGLEHGAFETIAWAVPGYVAPYLQILGIMRHIEYPTIYRNVRYMVSMLCYFVSKNTPKQYYSPLKKNFVFFFLSKIESAAP